jgi:hypothetical protein
MYQSASIAGKLSGSDRLGLGVARSAEAAPSWARPGQAARWAAAAPKPLPEWVSGPELTDADKPLMDPAEQVLDVALAGSAMLADVWRFKTKEAIDIAINKYLRPKSTDIEDVLNRYFSREEPFKFHDHGTREGYAFTKMKAVPPGGRVIIAPHRAFSMGGPNDVSRGLVVMGGLAQHAEVNSFRREMIEETSYDLSSAPYSNGF